MNDLAELEAEFTAAAGQAMTETGGVAALEALGWFDLLAGLDDLETRVAVFALFRAQGRTLGSTPALGALLASAYPVDGTVVAVVPSTSRRSIDDGVVVGDVAGRTLLVDRPGVGAWLVDASAAVTQPVAVPGALELHRVTVPTSGAPDVPEAVAAPARRRATILGRTALAFELLGAAESALRLASDYSLVREQFGQPIGAFQAMRHLLAWGLAECTGIEAVARTAVRFGLDGPEHHDAVVKALAGRNARKVCERALQVLGGIGFTEEHEHHRFHSRVLALDALLGSSAELTHELGRSVRTSGRELGFAAAAFAAT